MTANLLSIDLISLITGWMQLRQDAVSFSSGAHLAVPASDSKTFELNVAQRKTDDQNREGLVSGKHLMLNPAPS
jgi:hypothetical protein